MQILKRNPDGSSEWVEFHNIHGTAVRYTFQNGWVASVAPDLNPAITSLSAVTYPGHWETHLYGEEVKIDSDVDLIHFLWAVSKRQNARKLEEPKTEIEGMRLI